MWFNKILPSYEVLRTEEFFTELKLLGELLIIFKKRENLSTRKWAESYRFMSSLESAKEGRFDCMYTPWMLFVMECLDNPNIPVIVARKSAQIAWTETINNYLGKTIHLNPTKIMLAFARDNSITKYYKGKWRPFFKNNAILSKLINYEPGTKENREFFTFPGGHISFISLGSIGDQKSASAPIQIIEEPDDAPIDVSGQGDSLANLRERQKTYPKNRQKTIFGGTPTIKGLSRVEAAYLQSNQMVYMVPCHLCNTFHELSFDNLKIAEYPERRIDEVYGKRNPATAYYECPACLGMWTFAEKNANVKNAINFHNLGWYAKKPEVTDVYGFAFNELLSPFEASSFVELAKALILAEQELEKGKEGAMKSFRNNKMGLPFASGITSLEAEEMRTFRKNYPEHCVPVDGLYLTAGIDVQINRVAVIVRAWGRNNNSWLVSWFEIFGDTSIQNVSDDGTQFEGIWGEIVDKVINHKYPHLLAGKTLPLQALAIDCGYNTELVYNFVRAVDGANGVTRVFAVKGVKDLRHNDQEIYQEPNTFDITTEQKARKTLAETMGVHVYYMNSHRAQTEILTRVALNKKSLARSGLYYFNEQSYGQYEEQMTSCSKLFQQGPFEKAIYKLIPGKRKEAMDGEKLALWAAIAQGVRNFTMDHWRRIEESLK